MDLRTAGDMALEQTQVIDEYMAYGGREAYKLKMPSQNGDGFIEVDMFEGVFGLDSRVEQNKQEIFKRLYSNNDFKMLALRLTPMKTPIRYWNVDRTGFAWYYMPTVTMVGRDMLPNHSAINTITDIHGNAIPEQLAHEIFTIYGFNSYVKTSGGKEYYYTPINLGITYLNEDLLGTLFMNNLDLMMRQKYNSNLNTSEGGNGVLLGSTYNDQVKGSLDLYNPINNGLYTLLRGEQNTAVNSVKSFVGVKPNIVYKVIDMYDPINDDVLVEVFGPIKGRFNSKAEYLKDLDRHIVNPATGRPYDKKPIVVAKVTFYMDVVIPYTSLFIRDLRVNVGEGDINFVDLVDKDKNGVEGTKRISYTRYFTVTP